MYDKEVIKMMYSYPTKLKRRSDVPIGELLSEVFPDSPLAKGYKDYRLRSAWKQAADSFFPGAGEGTLRVWLREEDGVLFVTMSSSVLASQLRMFRVFLIEKVNELLSDGNFVSMKVCSVILK